MTATQLTSICDRHQIPAHYHSHFSDLVLDGRLTSHKFARLVRRNLKFKTCLEEMLDVLSQPFKHLFEPHRFESLTQEKVIA